jgi:hypothetical protein
MVPVANGATPDFESRIQKLSIEHRKRQSESRRTMSWGPPEYGAQLDVVVAGDHLLGELPHLLAVEEQDVLLGPPGAGHLGQAERRDSRWHVDPAAVAGGGREVEAGAEPAGGGGTRGRAWESCGARARRPSRGFGAGRGGGSDRCHPRRTRQWGGLLDVADAVRWQPADAWRGAELGR